MLRKMKDKVENQSGGTNVPVTTKNNLGTRRAPTDTMIDCFLHSGQPASKALNGIVLCGKSLRPRIRMRLRTYEIDPGLPRALKPERLLLAGQSSHKFPASLKF